VIIGGSISPQGVHAFRWTRTAGLVDLGQLPGAQGNTVPVSLSGDGSVIIGTSRNLVAFRWTQNGGIQPIDGLSGNSYPSVTRDGRAVFGGTAKPFDPNAPAYGDPVRWTEPQGAVDLANSLQRYAGLGAATVASADGSVAAGVQLLGGNAYGPVWVWNARDGMKSLLYRLVQDGVNPQLLSGMAANGAFGLQMSDDGRTIAGTGVNLSNSPFGWVVHLPELGALPGDANGDGIVNFTDLLVLAQNYGKTSVATTTDGDFNADGSVGFDDLLILAQHYGTGAAAAASPVPEASAGFAVAAAITALSRRSRLASVNSRGRG
jgi:hypothetical protein